MPTKPSQLSLDQLGAADVVDATQPSVKHVVRTFLQIPCASDHLIANISEGLPRNLYTRSTDNFDGYQNHLQGVQRLGNGKFLAVTGGDPHTPSSHLFIFKMGSRPKNGPWWPNIAPGAMAPPTDRLVTVLDLDRKHWHAGGMDVLGDVLAVPIEYPPPDSLPKIMADFKPPDFGKTKRSRVLFFDMTDPAIPKKLPVEIVRSGVTAGAVAFARLPNAHFLAAVAGGKGKEGRWLDFYLSKTKRLQDGFRNQSTKWFVNDVLAVAQRSRTFDSFQTINFVTQDDGELYLIGTHNTSPVAPIVNGDDYADLYHVQIPEANGKPSSPTAPISVPKITKVANLKAVCKNAFGNFSAGAGVHVDTDTLAIYSVGHWRTKNGKLRIAESRPPAAKCAGGAVKNTTAWIEMYDETHFRGRRLAVLGTDNMFLPRFKSVKAQGSGFNDRASSIRFQLPIGTRCRLYEHSDFNGRLLYTLVGTGKVEEVPRLPDKAKRKTSSMKCV